MFGATKNGKSLPTSAYAIDINLCACQCRCRSCGNLVQLNVDKLGENSLISMNFEFRSLCAYFLLGRLLLNSTISSVFFYQCFCYFLLSKCKVWPRSYRSSCGWYVIQTFAQLYCILVETCVWEWCSGTVISRMKEGGEQRDLYQLTIDVPAVAHLAHGKSTATAKWRGQHPIHKDAKNGRGERE